MTAEAECKRCMIGEEIRDGEIHDEETRYETLAEALGGQHFLARKTEFWD
jgi:hypothetical protein